MVEDEPIVTITQKNPGGRVARTSLVAGIRQQLATIATEGLAVLRTFAAGEAKVSRDRLDTIWRAVEHTIGKPRIAVDLTGTIDGVIRHDHILKTADALLDKSPGADSAPLTEAQMAQGALGADTAGTYTDDGDPPLLSPVGEGADVPEETGE